MSKVKKVRIQPQDAVMRVYRINPRGLAEGPWLMGETVASIARRTTIGAMPRLNKAEAQVMRSTEKARIGSPAAIVYQRGNDSNGRPVTFQSLTNMIRRSVGLPR